MQTSTITVERRRLGSPKRNSPITTASTQNEMNGKLLMRRLSSRGKDRVRAKDNEERTQMKAKVTVTIAAVTKRRGIVNCKAVAAATI
jgi:hypothetical protein